MDAEIFLLIAFILGITGIGFVCSGLILQNERRR